jgi:hypothetical protein
MSEHSLSVSIGLYGVFLHPICSAPVGAPCRMWCEQGCLDSDSEGHDAHELVDQGYCIPLEYITGEGPAWIYESYNGRDRKLVEGVPIELESQGEDFRWRVVGDHQCNHSNDHWNVLTETGRDLCELCECGRDK